MTYTANDPHRVTQLAAWGVDVIITDAIGVIRP
jgi:glycerophosphoryl diester phosphodiesterase